MSRYRAAVVVTTCILPLCTSYRRQSTYTSTIQVFCMNPLRGAIFRELFSSAICRFLAPPPHPIVTVQFTLHGAKSRLTLSSSTKVMHLNFNALNLGVPLFGNYPLVPAADFWHPPPPKSIVQPPLHGPSDTIRHRDTTLAAVAECMKVVFE